MPETNKTRPEVFYETAGDKIGNYLKKTEARHGTFLNNLGSRAGMLLKGFAVFVLVAGILLSIISGLVTFFEEPAWAKEIKKQSIGSIPYSHNGELYSDVRAQYRKAGLIILFGGCAGSIFTFLLILGFGQLVEEHTLMRKLMERQMGLPEDPEPESGKAENPQDVPPKPPIPPVPPTPEIRYKSDKQQDEAFSPRTDYAYTSSVEDKKEAEERLRVKWRTDKKKDGPDSGTDVKA